MEFSAEVVTSIFSQSQVPFTEQTILVTHIQNDTRTRQIKVPLTTSQPFKSVKFSTKPKKKWPGCNDPPCIQTCCVCAHWFMITEWFSFQFHSFVLRILTPCPFSVGPQHLIGLTHTILSSFWEISLKRFVFTTTFRFRQKTIEKSTSTGEAAMQPVHVHGTFFTRCKQFRINLAASKVTKWGWKDLNLEIRLQICFHVVYASESFVWGDLHVNSFVPRERRETSNPPHFWASPFDITCIDVHVSSYTQMFPKPCTYQTYSTTPVHILQLQLWEPEFSEGCVELRQQSS